MKKFLFTPLIFALLTACALDDTAENRSQQAGRYLKTVSPKKMLEKMLEKMAVKLPPDQRAIFKDLMTKHFNSNALEKVMVAGLLKHFTAEELRALADFHESSVGHSAMENFGRLHGRYHAGSPVRNVQSPCQDQKGIGENAEA